LADECPDDVAGSYRNGGETMVLGMALSDEHRIRILGDMASSGVVDPQNALFYLDIAPHFKDPSKAVAAQRLAEYNQVPDNRLGQLERFIRRVVHPSLRRYVK
jgi:hypothetical protein